MTVSYHIEQAEKYDYPLFKFYRPDTNKDWQSPETSVDNARRQSVASMTKNDTGE